MGRIKITELKEDLYELVEEDFPFNSMIVSLEQIKELMADAEEFIKGNIIETER